MLSNEVNVGLVGAIRNKIKYKKVGIIGDFAHEPEFLPRRKRKVGGANLWVEPCVRLVLTNLIMTFIHIVFVFFFVVVFFYFLLLLKLVS